jgi:hypothetical protein
MPHDLSARPVAISVIAYSPVAAELAARLGATLSARLQTYAREMLAGLHINRTPSVTVEMNADRVDPLRPVRVRIGGCPCAQPLTRWSSSPQQCQDSLPEHLEQLVCQNRALFVSERLVRDCRRAWGASGDIDGFLGGLLRRLVGHGFSLNRAKVWLDAGGDSAAGEDAAFEEAAGAAVPAHVYLPDEYRRDRATLAADLQQRCAARGGPLNVVLDFEHMEAEAAYQLRINDLLLPVVSKRAIGQKAGGCAGPDILLDAVAEEITRIGHWTITAATVDAQLRAVGERSPILEVLGNALAPAGEIGEPAEHAVGGED